MFIQHIPLIPNNFPFEFKRTQFSTAACFAMTINKSQGQTLKSTRVDLRYNCFTHGRLYVACSRISSADHLFLLTPEGKANIVIYKEILRVPKRIALLTVNLHISHYYTFNSLFTQTTSRATATM